MAGRVEEIAGRDKALFKAQRRGRGVDGEGGAVKLGHGAAGIGHHHVDVIVVAIGREIVAVKDRLPCAVRVGHHGHGLAADGDVDHRARIAGARNHDRRVVAASNHMAALGIIDGRSDPGRVVTATHGVIAAAQGVITAAHGVITAANGIIATAHGVITATHGVIATAQGIIAAAKGIVATAQGVIATARGVIATAQGIVAAAHGVITATHGVIATAQGVVAAAQGIVATA
ncbi:hypothetical protein ABFB10_12095 [Ponticoccus litoralis]|uniref:Uncharacterized protein n=1 Tax=Ponticoccus litoralis TaxID=422297 RepID=A0AAW9SA10_9RHOB